MNWLGNILEGVINEIDANQAYERFYSSIPREDYDKILNGEQNPDKLMQFILNGVRDGDINVRDGINVSKSYKEASPLIRQNVLNKFKGGEYESPLDMLYDIQYLNSGGVVSKKKFAKEGYIKLKETEDWIVTCTTNYLANNHYFGDTRWCTASDRMGRYDGYAMFKNYGMNKNCVLIQFINKHPVEAIKDESGKRILNIAEYGKNAFQVQIEPKQEGMCWVGMICDKLDHEVYSSYLMQAVGEDLYNEIVGDGKMIFKLLEIQNRQAGSEERYQDNIDKLIEAKKARLREKAEKEIRECREKADELNKEVAEIAKKRYMDFISSGKYKSKEFINFLYKRKNDVYNSDTTDEASAIYESMFNAIPLRTLKRKISVAVIGPVLGVSYTYETQTDESGFETGATVTKEIKDWYCYGDFGSWRAKLIIVFGEYDIEEKKFNQIYDAVVTTDENFADDDDIMVPLRSDSQQDRNFIFIEDYLGTHAIFNTNTGKLARFGKVRDGSWFNRFSLIKPGMLLYNSSATKLSEEKPVIYDGDSSAQELEPGDMIQISEKFAVLRLNGKKFLFNIITDNSGEGTMFEVPDDLTTVLGKQRQLLGRNKIVTAYVYTTSTVDNRMDCNFLLPEIMGAEPVFGQNTSYGRLVSSPDEGVLISYLHGDNPKKIKFDINDRKYYITDGNDDYVECDKFGRTAKDKLASKNFQDWRNSGGHSPEAKAQMDKMWADRNTAEKPGAAAMKAYDDNNDMYPEHVNPTGYLDVTAEPKDIQHKDWGGYIGHKDPYIRNIWSEPLGQRFDKNRHYRIDKNGNSLDQEWNTEDEFPAFSLDDDSPVNEAISLIKRMNK